MRALIIDRTRYHRILDLALENSRSNITVHDVCVGFLMRILPVFPIDNHARNRKSCL